MSEDDPYSEFQWNYFSSLPDGPLRARADAFLLSVDWEALLDYVTNIRDGMKCELISGVGLGYNYMVRVIRFQDKVQWVARLRLPSLENEETSSDIKASMKCEASTITLVRRNTKIPVPRIHALETDSDCVVKAPFMLMECLDGNAGMDLGLEIPPAHQQYFSKAMAEIQVELSTIQLPLIGTILGIDENGTICQGPIPGLGGPFATATEFFRVWCASAKFGLSNDQLRRACGPLVAEVIPSIESFPTKLAAVADRLSKFNKGPFPLIHGDFGHNNIVVNNDYQVIGVIDWEMAFAAPWEIAGDFPLTLSTIPPAMDAPWNYDELGQPKDADLAKKFADQQGYIAHIKDVQDVKGIKESPCLLDFLQDSYKQHLMTAMRLYSSGKVGFYSNLIHDEGIRETSTIALATSL